jgi:hypothetical protein
MKRVGLLVAWCVVVACGEKPAPMHPDPEPSPSTAPATSASEAPVASATPSASAVASAAPVPRPAASVELGKDPDVRATEADKGKTLTAHVGQTFGVLFKHRNDDGTWRVKSAAELGEPLTAISRGNAGVEHLWKIPEAAAGTNALVFELVGSNKKPIATYTVTLKVTR